MLAALRSSVTGTTALPDGCVAPTAARQSYPEVVVPQHTFGSSEQCAWAGSTGGIALVHIGKTAGGSLQLMLDETGVEYMEVHRLAGGLQEDILLAGIWPAQAALACEFTHFIVSVRDPVNRTISAFNYETFLYEMLSDPLGDGYAWRTPTLQKLYEQACP